MSSTDRLVRETFVELADTLVDDYDIIGFLDNLAHRVVRLFSVADCGLVLVDHHGTLNLVAASSEPTRLLELYQLQSSEGPCLDCFRSGEPAQCGDLATADEQWPQFAPAARAAGFAAVQAVPMRLRETAIGAMNLFSSRPVLLDDDEVGLARALADVATIGILHERTLRFHEGVTEQLQSALNSRILIEQAKGMLAEHLGTSVDEAFNLLRDYVRSRNLKLRDVARLITEGKLDIEEMAAAKVPETDELA